MRLIDADRLKAVLQNINEHLEGSEAPDVIIMAGVIALAMEIVDAQSDVEPSNDPLTLDELLEMAGPVWIVYLQETWGPQAITSKSLDCTRYKFSFEDYGETWLAYRRKPEMNQGVKE